MWATPQPIKTWGTTTHEAAAHVRWIDLFFDLLYVGVAFLVGHRLEHHIDHAHTHHGGHSSAGETALAATVDSFAVFFVLIGPWFSNLQFYSRFDVDDVLHKGIDVLEYVVIGCSAVFVPSPTLFWWGIVCARIVSLVRYMELAIFSKVDNARRMMRCAVGTELVSLVLSIIMIAPCGYVGALVTAQAWQIGNIILRVFFPSVFCLSRASSVPLHISFMTHRVGEVMMIMLGESVLSLVVTTLPDDNDASSSNNINGAGILPSRMFFVSLVMGFIISACLMWIEYLSSTFDPKKTCSSKFWKGWGDLDKSCLGTSVCVGGSWGSTTNDDQSRRQTPFAGSRVAFVWLACPQFWAFSVEQVPTYIGARKQSAC